MAGPIRAKRSMEGRIPRPSKKQKRQKYHSDSEDEEDKQEFDAVNLLDSDDDIHNANIDDLSQVEAIDSDNSSDANVKQKKPTKPSLKTKKPSPQAPEAESAEEDDGDSDEDSDDDEEDQEAGSGDESDSRVRKGKSKRNDPNAFATSLSKILSTKLSQSKRSDPVLSRSVAAHEAAKAAVDSALESKARRQMKEEKRQAMEKGRVKDVLIASNSELTGEPETTTTEILETERRLRKVAQRGVVKLFNAVRAAQVKAVETEKGTRKAGVIGMNHREEKVNEMSKKGFLELIASGGGGLKKGAIEEA